MLVLAIVHNEYKIYSCKCLYYEVVKNYSNELVINEFISEKPQAWQKGADIDSFAGTKISGNYGGYLLINLNIKILIKI